MAKKFKSETIEITDFSDEVFAALDSHKPALLNALGQTMERFAKKHETAVDTGRLRNSISYVLGAQSGREVSYRNEAGESFSYNFHGGADENAVYVGTNVEYAPYIEFGISKRKGVHFLQKSLSDHKDEYNRLIREYLLEIERSLKNA